MNPGAIWWGQLGTSLCLLETVTNHLRDSCSAVLRVPFNLPWRQVLYEYIDIRRTAFSSERRLIRLAWSENEDPGEFVLEHLCSDEVRANYWPGQTYAAYLGGRDDILLCDYYVWVTGLHSPGDLTNWAEFIRQYTAQGDAFAHRAVFVLEYDGKDVILPGVDQIAYSVEAYDCHVFSLEAAAVLGNTDLRTYQAELAQSISGRDPELCYALLETGKRLLQDPVHVAVSTSKTAFSSQNGPFAHISEKQAASAAWEATVVWLFPILERFRMHFIAEHQKILANQLPIHNSNGDTVKDPFDLEIGSLYFIVRSAPDLFSAEYDEAIRLCRTVRNLLAHNKVVPYDKVKKVLLLTGIKKP